MERFNLRSLNDVEVKEQYQVKISNMFAALEYVDEGNVGINRDWGFEGKLKFQQQRVYRLL
jgi:hypothetical protein